MIMLSGKLTFDLIYRVESDELYYSPDGQRVYVIILKYHPGIKSVYLSLCKWPHKKVDFERLVSKIGRYIKKYGRVLS